MEAIDRLIQNRSLRRIVIGFVIVLIVGCILCVLLSNLLAEHILKQQIEGMLAVLGGGKFTDLPTETTLANAEHIMAGSSITRNLPPRFMPQFYHTWGILFGAMYGCYAFASALLFGLAYYENDVQVREMEMVHGECMQLAEQLDRYCQSIGLEQSAIRRVCDGINQLLFQLRQRGDRFEQMQIRLREILTAFSHQLKTSLAIVRLNQDMLMEQQLSPAQHKRLAEEINLHLDGMENLVLNALRLTRIEADAIEYTMQEADLVDTLQSAVERMEPLCRSKGIALQFSHDADRSFVMPHDRLWFREAIENLIKNAADHAECHSLHLELTIMAGAFKLLLTDDGKGIQQREIPLLFRPAQWHKRDLSMKNAGVGLPIAKKIVEAHGGDIAVYRTVTGGTQFVIVLLHCYQPKVKKQPPDASSGSLML